MDASDCVINPRKLAAIHIATLGLTFAIGNFAGSALLCLAVGGLILRRAESGKLLAFGFYFVSLSINYAFMLFCALKIDGREGARAEIGDELNNRHEAMAEYRSQSLYLLLPLLVLIGALQRRSKSRPSR